MPWHDVSTEKSEPANGWASNSDELNPVLAVVMNKVFKFLPPKQQLVTWVQGNGILNTSWAVWGSWQLTHPPPQ
jgi:hypothetical protein